MGNNLIVSDHVYLVQDEEQKLLIIQKLGDIVPVDKTWVFELKYVDEKQIVIENVDDENRSLILPLDSSLIPEDYPFRDVTLISDPFGGSHDE